MLENFAATINEASAAIKAVSGLAALALNVKIAPFMVESPINPKFFNSLVVVVVFGITFDVKSSELNFWLFLSSLGTIVFVALYVGLRTKYTVEKQVFVKPPFWKIKKRPERKKEKVLTGFALKPEIVKQLGGKKMSAKQLMENAGYQESKIWTDNSRTFLTITAFVLYVLVGICTTATLSLATGKLVSGNSGEAVAKAPVNDGSVVKR
ncbi:hypothetical protein [Paraburkholderia sp. HD33-4]|uniref:hypothetical protein n=1 Tax=Paraburkholderia sp. HD33-4 TaxID=2883242 RepID=UPI001F291D32|nr:hypothetical protein [Paraburkholderia sp. HD33-4]